MQLGSFLKTPHPAALIPLSYCRGAGRLAGSTPGFALPTGLSLAALLQQVFAAF